MNDLRNAFKNAGLINKKDDKRFRHEERVRRKELGAKGQAAEREAEEKRRAEQRAQQKQAVQEAQARHDQQSAQRKAEKHAAQNLRNEAQSGTGGPKRFHYEDPEGYLPFLSLNDDTIRKLQGGELAIVLAPSSSREVLIVPRPVGERWGELHPEAILHMVGAGR